MVSATALTEVYDELIWFARSKEAAGAAGQADKRQDDTHEVT